MVLHRKEDETAKVLRVINLILWKMKTSPDLIRLSYDMVTLRASTGEFNDRVRQCEGT